MTSAISFFRKAFDAAPAKKNGVIRPKPGVDTVFDEAKVRDEMPYSARFARHRRTNSRSSELTSPVLLSVVQRVPNIT